MITFLGAIVLATVIAIGEADRRSGLHIFQKYTGSPPKSAGPLRRAGKPPR